MQRSVTGANTYNGLTTVSAGTLAYGASNVISTGGVTIDGATAVLSLGANQTDSVGTVTVDGGGSITGTGTSALTSTGTFEMKSGSVSAILAGSGSALNQTTSGTVTLTGTNTYTGATTITAGTLQLDGSTHSSSTVAIGTSGTLTGTGTVNGNATLTGSGVINKSSGTIVGTLGVTGGNWNGNGSVTGLVTSSSGTFTIGNGANLTADGDLAVTGGSIVAGNTASTITGSVNYSSSADSSFDGVIAGSAKTLTKSGASTLTLTGINTYTGLTTVNAGTLAYGASNVIATGGVTVDGATAILDLGANRTDTVGTVTVDGGGSITGTGTSTLTSTGTFEMKSGSVSAILAGSGIALNKTTTGTVTLSGANTYSGATTVSGGTLRLTNLNAILGSSSVSVASGAMLQANLAGTFANTGTVTIAGTGVGANKGALDFSTGGNTSTVWSAPIVLSAAATLHSFGINMSQTLNGAISGTGPLTISSRGGNTTHTAVWTLNAANSYSGNTIFYNDNGIKDVTIKLGIADALPTATSLNLSGNSTQAVATFVTLDLNGFAQTLAGLTDTGATDTNAAGFGKRVINSSNTLATLTISNSGSVTYGTAGTNVLEGTIGGTTAAGMAADNIALTKTGAGTLTLAGTNTYTGATTVNNGALNIRNATALGTITSGTTVDSGAALQIQGDITVGAEALSLAGTGVSNDGALRNISGANTFGGLLTLTGAARINSDAGSTLTLSNTGAISGATFDLTVGGAGDTVIAGVIGTTTGTLTKDGAGTLTLTGANTYTGITTISAGTLQIGDGTTDGSILDTSGITNNATLTFNLAGSQTSAVAISGSGTLTKSGAGTLTLTVSNSYTGGTTINAGTLSVADSSALGLESNGLTIASGATLKVTESFSTSRATVLGGTGGAGGTFEVAAGKTLNYTSTSSISGTGSLIKTGGGTLFLEGTNNHTGGIYMVAGTLSADSQEALGAVPAPGSSDYGLHLYDGATFQTKVGSWVTYRQLELVGDQVGSGGLARVDVTNGLTHQRDGLITGAGKLNLVGTGTLIVNAANTYTGGTLIDNGVLRVGNSTGSATGTGAVTVASGGTLQGSATAGQGFITGAVTVQSGERLTAASGGTLTLADLTLAAGSLGTFQLGSLPASPLVNITNLFALPGSGTSTFEIENSGLMAVGTYTLFDYTGTAFSSISTLALAQSHTGLYNLTLVHNTANTSIDLDVTAIAQQWKKGGVNTN